MKLLVVRYSRRLGRDDPDQARGFLAAAEKIAGLPGLRWKLWGYDDSEHVAESVYLFDTDQQAQAWGDGPMKSVGRAASEEWERTSVRVVTPT